MTRKLRRSPGRPIASARQDTRAVLITCATELFAQHGVAATSFAMIAKYAGVTPAMLHYYFSDRDQLLDAVVDQRIAPILEAVWGSLPLEKPVQDVIEEIIDRLLRAMEQVPWVPPTWMHEVLNENGMLRHRILQRLPYDKMKILAELIQQAQRTELINSDLHPGLTIFSLIGLVMMHLAMARPWSDVFQLKVPNRTALNRHIKGLLFYGLQPLAGPSQ